MNLKSCLSFSFQSDIVSYEYDEMTGRLMVNALYSESIEGQRESLVLNMNGVMVKTDQVQAEF